MDATRVSGKSTLYAQYVATDTETIQAMYDDDPLHGISADNWPMIRDRMGEYARVSDDPESVLSPCGPPRAHYGAWRLWNECHALYLVLCGERGRITTMIAQNLSDVNEMVYIGTKVLGIKSELRDILFEVRREGGSARHTPRRSSTRTARASGQDQRRRVLLTRRRPRWRCPCSRTRSRRSGTSRSRVCCR